MVPGPCLVAKFVPGLTTVMPPLAGVFARLAREIRPPTISGGILLWAGTWMGLGYVFSDAIALVAARATGLGRALGLVVVAALAATSLVKYLRRRLFPADAADGSHLSGRSKAAARRQEDVTIIDVRTRLDLTATPYAIQESVAGGRRLDEHESGSFEARGGSLLLLTQRGHSARVALQLSARGSHSSSTGRGLAAWMAPGLSRSTLQVSTAVGKVPLHSQTDAGDRRPHPPAAAFGSPLLLVSAAQKEALSQFSRWYVRAILPSRMV